MTDQDKAYLAHQKQRAQAQISDQLQGVYSGYKEGAIEGLKTAPFIPLGGVAGKAAELAGGGIRGALAAAGTQAAGSAAITKAEGGSNADAALSGGIGAAGELAPIVAKPLANAAVNQYTRALSPTTKPMKTIAAKVVPEMMDRNVHGSLESINDLARENASDLRPQIDSAIDALDAKGKAAGAGSKILSDLESLKQNYYVDGKIADPDAVNAISGVQDVVKQFGDDISPSSLRKLRQIFDNPVAKKGGYAGTDLGTAYALQAKEQAANTIREIFKESSPDLAKLNKEMNFWLNVQRVTDATALRRTGQEGGLLKTLGPLGVGLAGATGLATHGASTALRAASMDALATGVGVASRTARWRTGSALLKNSLADALAAGDVPRAISLLGRFGVTVQAGQKTNGTEGQTATQ